MFAADEVGPPMVSVRPNSDLLTSSEDDPPSYFKNKVSENKEKGEREGKGRTNTNEPAKSKKETKRNIREFNSSEDIPIPLTQSQSSGDERELWSLSW